MRTPVTLAVMIAAGLAPAGAAGASAQAAVGSLAPAASVHGVSGHHVTGVAHKKRAVIAFAFGPVAFAAAGPAAAVAGPRFVLAFGAVWSALSSAAVLAMPAVRAVTWQPPCSGERPGS